MIIPYNLNNPERINYIKHTLTTLAFDALQDILPQYENKLIIEIKDLNFTETLSILLTSIYQYPVFEFKIQLMNNNIQIGHYRYITDMQFTYIDEYFCIY